MATTETSGGAATLSLEQAQGVANGPAYTFGKRAMDLVLGSVLVVVTAPIVLLAAALVWLTSRGPVVFKQQRGGLHGKPFIMYKFRTMYEGAQDDRQFLQQKNEKDGPVFKIADDPRLTLVGKFLRRSSIDELPQLFNVLAGQMSLVGPRPMWFPEAQQVTGPAKLRTAVKPGLTCLWQISGRSELSYDEWISLDRYYVLNRSLLLDLLIIIQTIPIVISGYGAY